MATLRLGSGQWPQFGYFGCGLRIGTRKCPQTCRRHLVNYKCPSSLKSVIDIFVVFVTGNANKLREVKEILAPYNIEIEARSLDGVLSDDLSTSTSALITLR